MTPLDAQTCPLSGVRLIEASAGTGKTWNICGLYARLLLEERLTVREILVVTFTNAAAAELKERIRARLADLRDALNGVAVADPFVNALLPRLTEAAEELAKRLRLALESFDEAAIHTIHGFCQRALADVPFAAGLPLDLELVEDDREEREEAARDFWRRRLHDPAFPADLAAHLAGGKDAPEYHARLLQRRLARPLTREIWPDAPVATTDAIDPAELWNEVSTAWRRDGATILELVGAALPELNANSYKAEALKTSAASWDAHVRVGDPLAPLGEKMDLLSASRLAKGTKKNRVTPTHPFLDLADAYLQARAAQDERLRGARLALLREMLDDASRHARAEKEARRRVAFDDLLFNLHERLADGRHPWLAPLLAKRWPAALIDEFQDTDPLQLAIFRAIHAGGGRALFLVGDPKQAIYGFRHADLQTYLRARDLADAEYALADNQRSSAGLIAALNHLFSRNPDAFLLKGLAYQAVNHGAKPRPTFEAAGDAGAELRVWLLDDGADLPDKEQARAAAARATAGEIARLLANAEEVRIGGRPLHPADLAVLVRSHRQGTRIKEALAELGVGSVEMARDGVFQSEEAEDLERLLRALLEPGRTGLARAALSGPLLGLDAAALEALAADELAFAERLQRFAEDRDAWLQRGFGPFFQRLLARENVAARLLARRDGERRLTNYLHLAELLQRAGERHAAPEALLRHLESQRQQDDAGEAAQLRLESDRDLVRILTIHKAKGLEFPIVFCPYVWDGGAHPGGGLEGREYHDEQGLPVIDWRPQAAEDAAIKAQGRLEGAAEDMRLLYVACTRAVHRLYLVAGSYLSRNSASESGKSLLHWLLAGAGISPEQWFKSGRDAASLHAAWLQLGEHAHVTVTPLPAADQRYQRAAAETESLQARPAPAAIPPAWRIGSFSSLTQGARHEEAARDHDARARAAPDAPPEGLAADDILRFPRGAAAGDCLHALFEIVDFQDRGGWDAAIAQALARHPLNTPASVLAPMLHKLLADVLDCPLLPDLRLRDVAAERRLAELEFHLPAARLDAAALNALLEELGLPGPRLGFNRLDGYLKGYIDLVFERGGRYYVLDWKSNYLGHHPQDYDQPALAAAMAEHGYHLQALLYALALRRHLARRQPDAAFGGVIHLFLRGARPVWKSPEGKPLGVYFQRPGEEALARLEAVLGL